MDMKLLPSVEEETKENVSRALDLDYKYNCTETIPMKTVLSM